MSKPTEQIERSRESEAASNDGGQVRIVPVDSIKPSPENDEIYGAINPGDPELIYLAKDIRSKGIREPIQVSGDGFIISGHRRYAAAKLIGLQEIPVVEQPFERVDYDHLEWMKILRAFNLQRVKSASVRRRELALDINPEIAHRQLIQAREERSRDIPPAIEINGEKRRSSISPRKEELLNAALKVVSDLKPFWPLSVRQIHYGLLNNPPLRNSSKGSQRAQYENDGKSYQDLCDLLTRARLNGRLPFAAIADLTRPRSGTFFHVDAMQFAQNDINWMFRNYRRDLLQSQPDHIELVVEKLTVQNIVRPIADKYCMPMTIGRGYCSIDPRHDIVQRYQQSGKDRMILLIGSDFDPDGEEIATSMARSIRDDFGIDEGSLVAHKVLLRQDQISAWSLPPNAMEAKSTSAQFKKFIARYGSKNVYELEAVPPNQMQTAIAEAIESVLDMRAFNKELASEKADAVMLQTMKNMAADVFRDMLENDFDSPMTS